MGKQPAAVDLAGVVLNDQGKPAASFKTRLSVKPLSGNVSDDTQRRSGLYLQDAPGSGNLSGQDRDARRTQREIGECNAVDRDPRSFCASVDTQ